MLYQKGIGLIQQKLDVISIIKDSFQLAIIKSMFFNNEHIILLDNIIKTELSSEKYDKNLNSLINAQKVNKEVAERYAAVYKDIENQFQGFFGTKVKIDAGKRSGKIIINYTNNDDLERILNLIK